MTTDSNEKSELVYDDTVMGRIGAEIGFDTAMMLMIKGNFEALVFGGIVMGLNHPEWAKEVVEELRGMSNDLVDGADVVAKAEFAAESMFTRFKVVTHGSA